ncbi:MAG TPA: twin-arginine translocase subunit TatC [Candidatus Aquilonibacter sp.]|nr:twin-arginine translocase subunit TatC [Candidatus Aquilonibacter sp.]
MANITPANTTNTPDSDDSEQGRMSFFEHLAELRKRIISALMGIAIGSAIGLTFSQKFVILVEKPLLLALKRNGLPPSLYVHAPTDAVSLWINIGVYMGVGIAMPWVLYQVWLFVAPGLYKHERRALSSFIFFGTVLFALGVAFAYFIMLPQMLDFLVHFTTEFSLQPLIEVNEYLSLILIVTVGIGVIFEMPVIVYILSMFGLVTPKFLLKNFRYAMLIITVAAAIITPTPDATTMLVFMMPMVGLYFVSVLVSYMVVRKRRAKEAAQAAV